jgi:hypothetical protein
MAASKVTQQLPLHTWTHAVGELSIHGRIESKFSPSGKLLFVLAFVGRADFEETYGPHALSAIVHKGRVLTLDSHNNCITMCDRFHGQIMDVDFATDRYGFSILRLRNKSNTLFKKQIGFDTERNYKFDLKTIRWIANRFIQANPLPSNLALTSSGTRSTLHIIPEEEDVSLVEDVGFLRSEVLWH